MIGEETAGCDGFFEESEESSAEDVQEVEEVEDNPEQVVRALLSELVDRIAEEEEGDDEAAMKDDLDDFIVFRKGIDYRSRVVLPENFMSELYEASYARKK